MRAEDLWSSVVVDVSVDRALTELELPLFRSRNGTFQLSSFSCPELDSVSHDRPSFLELIYAGLDYPPALIQTQFDVSLEDFQAVEDFLTAIYVSLKTHLQAFGKDGFCFRRATDDDAPFKNGEYYWFPPKWAMEQRLLDQLPGLKWYKRFRCNKPTILYAVRAEGLISEDQEVLEQGENNEILAENVVLLKTFAAVTTGDNSTKWEQWALVMSDEKLAGQSELTGSLTSLVDEAFDYPPALAQIANEMPTQFPSSEQFCLHVESQIKHKLERQGLDGFEFRQAQCGQFDSDYKEGSFYWHKSFDTSSSYISREGQLYRIAKVSSKDNDKA